MFGREPCLSIDSWGQTVDATLGKGVEDGWLSNQWEKQQEAWRITKENTDRNWKVKAKPRLEKSKIPTIKVGQKVLLRENKIIGRSKLAEKYRKEPWNVVEVLNESCGLYRIKSEDNEIKVIHRNNIRPLPNSNICYDGVIVN